METTPVPSFGDEHWAPPHVVLARRVLAYAGRLFVERDANGTVMEYSPLSGMAAVEHRYPAWALGPFSRIEPEFDLPEQPGVYALVTDGAVRYVGHAKDVDAAFGIRAGIGHISRRARAEERCRLNRLITAEARAGRTVDLYVLALESVPWWRFAPRPVETPVAVATEILQAGRGDWHPPE